MLCVVHHLGLIGYGEAYNLQKKLLFDRLDGKIADILLLLEHPPTITLGKSGKLKNVLSSQEELAEQGIALVSTDRGGDVTYHGPGQLVGYPVIDLRERGKDIHKYVHDLEEVLIRTLDSFSITAARDERHPGVWVGDREIGAIGISIKRWITMHGFALNVNPNMGHFSLINPCGFSDRKAASIAELLAKEVPLAEVEQRLIAHFADVFDAHIELDIEMLAESPA